MSKEDPVQDNVIFVPFNLQREIYSVARVGGHSDVLAAATGCEPWVVETIVRFRRRKDVSRYLGASKDPA